MFRHIHSPQQNNPSHYNSEVGQAFVGFVLALTAIMLLTISASRYFLSLQKEDSATRLHGELALQAAKAGFTDTLSWFQRHQGTAATHMNGPNDNKLGVYPDNAFMPEAIDNDFFNSPVADPVGNSAIVHTEQMPETQEIGGVPRRLWIRYVVKRQFNQNFPINVPAYAAANDPGAVHDISHLRGDTLPGSGSRWQITSRGYAFMNDTNITDPNAHVGKRLYNSPLKIFNKQPLLVGSAEVTGEIVKLNFFDNQVAIWVNNGSNVNIGAKCRVDGNGFYGIGRKLTGTKTGSGTLVDGYLDNLSTPSYSSVFGFSLLDLKKIADAVGGKDLLPAYDPAKPDDYKDQISRQKFLILEGNTTFTTPPAAPDPNHRLLNGTGLLIVNGNLTVETGTGGNWNGVLFVNGNVVINKPFEVRGTLIATGTITLVGSPDVVEVFYSPEAINAVKKSLINFRVEKESMISRINAQHTDDD